MSHPQTDRQVENGREITAFNSWVDLACVFGISAIAFFVESYARNAGMIAMSESSTGFMAVLAGCATAVLLLFLRRQNLVEIGFRSPTSWKAVPFWVIGIVVVFLVVQIAMPYAVGMFLELPEADMSRYDSLYHNLPAALMMILVLPLTASIPEEIIYRGFLMDRLTRIFGDNLAGLIATVAIQSLIFGLIHFQWGLGGMITTFVMGVIWGTAFLLVGRNLWIVIMAHSLGHIVMITQLYLVKASTLG